jgi:integrase
VLKRFKDSKIQQIMSNSISVNRVAENLYQNSGSKTYFAIVWHKGKTHKSNLGTTDRAEAKRKLAAFIADLDKVDSEGAKMTVAAFVDRYLATLGAQSAVTTTKKSQMAKEIRNAFGERKARSITSSDVLKWRSGLRSIRCKGLLGPNTRNKYLRTIRAIFHLAVNDRLLASSPVAGIKEERLPKPIRDTPTFAEFTAIVTSIRIQPWSDTAGESSDFVEFLGLAGLGLAEANSLTWADVHFDRNEIITFRHKTATGFRIPIYPQLRPLLIKRLKLATDENGGVEPPLTRRVFHVADPKKAIENACVRLKYVRLKGEREVARYSSRSFRRMFITQAIERGIDVGVVADWQGHRDGGKLILSTYRHARTSHGDAMATRMTLERPANVIPIASAAPDTTGGSREVLEAEPLARRG